MARSRSKLDAAIQNQTESMWTGQRPRYVVARAKDFRADTDLLRRRYRNVPDTSVPGPSVTAFVKPTDYQRDPWLSLASPRLKWLVRRAEGRWLAGPKSQEYEIIVKNEVRHAMTADEVPHMFSAPTTSTTSRRTPSAKKSATATPATTRPDERLMRSVEEKIDIPEGRKDDFRREIMNYIGALPIDGKKFDYKTN